MTSRDRNIAINFRVDQETLEIIDRTRNKLGISRADLFVMIADILIMAVDDAGRASKP